MNDKTGIYEPNIYLASDDLVIKANKSMKIGRSQGDIILEDDELLSSLHCQITPAILDLYIMDLGSTNGVFVNNQRIVPGEQVKVLPRDEVVIGNHRFIFLNDYKEVQRLFPKERRKHPRPKNLWGPINLVNFYSAPMYWKAIYAAMILLAIRSFVWNAHILVPLPDDLLFLGTIYHEQIWAAGIKITLFVWAMCLLHSFLLTVYFNRNSFRKLVSFAAFVGVLISTVDFIDGPLWDFKTYVESRNSIMNGDKNVKPILRLRGLRDHEAVLAKSFNRSIRRINGRHRKLMLADFKKLEKKIQLDASMVNDKKYKLSEMPGEE